MRVWIMIYRAFPLVFILVVAFIPAVVGAQSFPVEGGLPSLGLPSSDGFDSGGFYGFGDAQGQGYFLSIGVRKYINSFTSDQWPNPYHPEVDPESRLEWPWEQVVGVIKLGYASPAWDMRFVYASTLLLPSSLKAQDSDWTLLNDPDQKTTFSDAKAEPRIWTFDASIAPVLTPLLKGVVGLRIQQFRFTYTDMLQRSLLPGFDKYFPGAVFDFSQYYYQWYGGGILTVALDLGALYGPLLPAPLVFRLQGDCGYVKGNNEDIHFIGVEGQPPPRIFRESTTGYSWHVNATIGLRITSTVAVSVEGDMLRVRTRGTQHFINPPTGITFSVDGSKVWSDQMYVEVNGSISF